MARTEPEEAGMLNRRDFGGGLAAGAVVRRRGADQPKSQPAPAPAKEPNLARILRTKRLRIAGLSGGEPYTYKETTGSQWGGSCIAMARDLAAELGVELAVVETSWTDLVTDLHTGKIDLAYGPSPTAQNAMFVDFAAPLFHDTIAIVARKGFASKYWAEINVPQTLIAIETGSPREAAARRFVGNAAITGFKTREEVLQAVQSGRADCLVATVFLALIALKRNPQLGELIVPTPHFRSAVCPAIPYDDDRRFRGVIDAWSEDHRGTGQIREWMVAALAKFGIEPDGLPPDVSF
jgi:polar amino acid transport system substrate-binding protein